MYKGKFDMGWDKAREMIFANQMKMGLLPAGTKLSNGIPEIPEVGQPERASRRSSTRARWRSSPA